MRLSDYFGLHDLRGQKTHFWYWTMMSAAAVGEAIVECLPVGNGVGIRDCSGVRNCLEEVRTRSWLSGSCLEDAGFAKVRRSAASLWFEMWSSGGCRARVMEVGVVGACPLGRVRDISKQRIKLVKYKQCLL